MEPANLLLHLEEPANCPVSKPHQSVPCPPFYFLKIQFSFNLPSTPRTSKWYFFLRFLNQDPLTNHPTMCYMPRPFHSSWFYDPNNSCWGVQIIQLFVMQSFPLLLLHHPCETQINSSAPYSTCQNPCLFSMAYLVQRISPRRRPLCTACSTESFYSAELLAPRPTSKMGKHTLLAIRDLLFTIFAVTFHIRD
jgi:hypothetical protein